MIFDKVFSLIKNKKEQKQEKVIEKIKLENVNLDKKQYNLEQYKLLNTVYYIKNFITEEQENIIINHVNEFPFVQLKNRRVQRHGGEVTEDGLIQEQLPEFLQKIIQNLVESNLFPDKYPNTALINEYQQGQGIMPHQDGKRYHPYVCILSLGSYCIFNIYENQKQYDLLLEQNSLLIFKDNVYTDYYHGIQEKMTDEIGDQINIKLTDFKGDKREWARDKRLSITIRYVQAI